MGRGRFLVGSGSRCHGDDVMLQNPDEMRRRGRRVGRDGEPITHSARDSRLHREDQHRAEQEPGHLHPPLSP
ncbi:hypothetical protein NQZ68_018316 [Dissostichus eleginoides]|nr:hypothetical protein NQZ68_018316 [Dissostichus eleginoides]